MESSIDQRPFSEQFLSYMEAQKRCSPLTLRNYTRDIELFEEWLDREYGCEFSLSTAGAEHVRGWMMDRLKPKRKGDKAISAASMNRALATLRSMYKWGEGRGLVERNPMRSIPALKSDMPLPHFIPKGRMSEVIDGDKEGDRSNPMAEWMARRDDMLIKLFYYTGMRLSEIASLRTTSFNSDLTTVKVLGKGGKERVIPIVERLRYDIIDYLDQISPPNICINHSKSLFLSNRAAPLSTSMIYRIIRRELSEAGVQGRKSPHVLRHTFATHLLNEGGDIRVIQELLGHTSLQATQRYTHNSITTLRATYVKSHPRERGESGESGVDDDCDE